MKEKIRSFTGLDAWKQAHLLVLDVYREISSFPSTERFCLSDQIHRSVISISSNIAEGFSRRTNREKEQFYYIALGSLTELQNLLLISKDLKYINLCVFHQLAEQTVIVAKLIRSLIRYLGK